MKILTVIHGYPNYYMAGSEVYTYNLCNELAKNNEVEVFTRYENPYEELYSIHKEVVDNIPVSRVNKPSRDYTFKDKYIDENIDKLFEEKLLSFKPDIVYIGHLCHLSTSIPLIAKKHGVKTAFTIHDFWMFCYRGQMITASNTNCDSFSIDNCYDCAKTTFKDWIKKDDIIKYRNHLDDVLKSIDIFFAPSKTVYDYYVKNGVDESKIKYSKYGFDTQRINHISKKYNDNSKINFGFMGRVIPVKGMKTLFNAFKEVSNAKLTIYGSQSDKRYLDLYGATNVCYYGSYNNTKINKVLSEIDVLVVPSIWLENAPLVIQEAHLAGIPVITSDFGGMKELVENGKDGFLFPVKDSKALADIIRKISDNPTILNTMQVNPKKVRSIKDDANYILAEIEKLNITRLGKLDSAQFPWRITFDTNPGICNIQCEMCEVHSPYNRDRKTIKTLPIMDFNIIEKIIKEGVNKGLKEIIPSTMGEPLLYKDFDKIVDLCKKTGVKMNLTTNGTFPKKTKEEWAKILVPICSDIKISQNQNICGKSTIMRGISPMDSFKAIKIFVDERNRLRKLKKDASTITVQATFMKKNLYDLADMIEIYGSRDGLGVDRIKGHHLWITWPQLEGQSMRTDTESIQTWNKMVDVYKTKSYANGVKLQNFEKIDYEDSIIDTNSLCPFLGKEAWISANGTFNVCCCPDNLRKEFGEFGNVSNASLSSLWNGEFYKNFIKNWGDYNPCNKCNMRILNREVI